MNAYINQRKYDKERYRKYYSILVYIGAVLILLIAAFYLMTYKSSIGSADLEAEKQIHQNELNVE